MRRVLISLLLALALLACGGGGTPPNPVTGLITEIDGTRLTLESDAGGTFSFEIGDPNVPVEHLHEHRRDRLPVRITWEGDRLATSIEDA